MSDRPAEQICAPVPIRVLILEDDPSDAELMAHALKQAGYVPDWTRVDSEREFCAQIEPGLDLILSDFSLPQYSGLHALRHVRGLGLDVPFILVSGSIGEEIAVAAMHGGADDYLLKDRMTRLGTAVQQALAKRRLRREAAAAELKIRRLNRVHAMLSAVNSLIVRVDDKQALFEGACRIAVEHGDFGLAWIGEFDASRMIVNPLVVAGVDDKRFIMDTPAHVGADGPNPEGAIARAIHERHAIVDNDIAAAPESGGERRKEAIRRGYRSLIALPLLVDDAPVGTFAIFAEPRDFFDNEETRLLTELASNIAFALDHMARQHKIEKLSRVRAVSSRINAAIVRIREREALLQETCRIATEHGKFPFVWIGEVNREAKTLRPIASAGYSRDAVASVDWASATHTNGTLFEAIRTGRVVVRNDLRTTPPTGRLRQEAIDGGCLSTVCVPLHVDDTVVALILLGAAEINFFDQDELMLLDEVSADVSFALQTIVEHEQVEYLSYYDPLTGLPNRALFIDRVGQTMRGRGEEETALAAVLLNVERFRNINETFTRHGGDQILRQIAQRLETAFQGKDYLARIGADGFGVLLAGTGDHAQIARILEQQVLSCFREPFLLEADEVRVAAQAGIAIYPADAASSETLFSNAEAALKGARESGERYLFYTADMNAHAANVLTLETRLRKAVDEQQFVLHYQPKIEIATGRISGLEALIRWQDPQSGLVPPGQFIPLLEETGLILEVGKWALERALADHRYWSSRGCTPPRVAVNVSAIQLRRRDFVEYVFDAVQKDGNRPESLELEITETLLMHDVQGSVRTLSRLRDMQIHIAMDDFGTGYSSLSYIARLPLSSVKIDRSFVSTMCSSPQDMSIVSTIVALAHSLNLKVVAEGVEKTEELDALRAMNCHEAQGYLFSRPVPAEEIERLLRNDAADCTMRNPAGTSQ